MRRIVCAMVVAAGCGRLSFDASDAMTGLDGSLPIPGCVGGEAAGPFITDFSQGVPAFGAIYETSPAQMDVFQGQLRGRPGASPGSTVYAGLELDIADYRERRVFVQVPTMLAVTGCGQVAVVIQDDDLMQYAELSQSCGMVEALLYVGSTPTVLAQLAYDAAAHRWWQLSARAGTLTFEVSADGVLWTEIASTSTPAYFDDAYVELSAGTYQLETVIGEARFDDLFDCLNDF